MIYFMFNEIPERMRIYRFDTLPAEELAAITAIHDKIINFHDVAPGVIETIDALMKRYDDCVIWDSQNSDQPPLVVHGKLYIGGFAL